MMNNNIDKILKRELKYKYLNKVENGLTEYNLTFRDLNNYVRCGRTPAFCNPDTFAYFARTAIRLLSLNIAFMGGIHYGFAAATWETAISEEEK